MPAGVVTPSIFYRPARPDPRFQLPWSGDACGPRSSRFHRPEPASGFGHTVTIAIAAGRFAWSTRSADGFAFRPGGGRQVPNRAFSKNAPRSGLRPSHVAFHQGTSRQAGRPYVAGTRPALPTSRTGRRCTRFARSRAVNGRQLREPLPLGRRLSPAADPRCGFARPGAQLARRRAAIAARLFRCRGNSTIRPRDPFHTPTQTRFLGAFLTNSQARAGTAWRIFCGGRAAFAAHLLQLAPRAA